MSSKMGKYDYIMESGNVPDNSCLSSCSFNCGSIQVGENCKITKCSYNTGNIRIGAKAKIDTLAYNTGPIHIGENSQISTIKFNCGVIHLGENCVVDHVNYNAGCITAGPGSIIANRKLNAGVITVLGKNHGGGFEKHMDQSGSSESDKIHQVQYATMPMPSAPVPLEPELDSTLTEEDVEFQSKAICSICMENKQNVAFGSCGHLCCVKCSESLTVCHMCRKPITQKIKLFL